MPSRIDIGPEGGPFVAINENSNDLELQDINGNVIAVWDETEGQWDLNNNSLTNINAIDANTVNTGGLNGTTQVLSGDTIQGAHDSLPSTGGKIDVTAEYDPTAETLPILIDKPCRIEGPGDSFDDPELDFSGNTTDPVFEVFLPTTNNDHENAVVIGNFRVRGGDVGIAVDSSQRGTYHDMRFLEQNSAMVELRNTQQSPFANTFARVHGENTNHGFFETSGAGAHATQIHNCTVIQSTGDPLNFNSGEGVFIIGGDYEKNDGIVSMDNGYSVIAFCYFEDNNQSGAVAYGIDFRADGGVVAFNRFQGLSNNSAAVSTNFTENVDISHNLYANYTGGFVRINGNASDVDVHHSTNSAKGSTSLLEIVAGNRPRSDGVIGGGPLDGVDLSSTTGQFVGDRAIADGTSAAATNALARWDGSSWQYQNYDGSV